MVCSCICINACLGIKVFFSDLKIGFSKQCSVVDSPVGFSVRMKRLSVAIEMAALCGCSSLILTFWCICQDMDSGMLVWLLFCLTALCCCYINYRIGVFLKHFVFHILDALKSKHPPCVKSLGLEYKELPLNSAFLYLVGLGRPRNLKATCKMCRKVSSVSDLISTRDLTFPKHREGTPSSP